MTRGSNLIAFDVKGGKANAFILANSLQIAHISNNLGDAKTLITHPATTTHAKLNDEAKAELAIQDGTLRFSVRLGCGRFARRFRTRIGEIGIEVSNWGIVRYMQQAITRNIAVSVETRFLEGDSDPDEQYFVWAYRITIERKSRR